MNDQVEEITTEDKRVKCDYCHKSGVNSLEWGPLYRYGGVTVHYFCMLFSAGLSQNGEDDEGILGFLPKDIRKELRRGDKLRCKYCRNTRATIGCSVKTCKLSYHYPCGLEEKCEFHFIGNFESYCSRHKKIKKIPLPKEEWECPICFTDVTDGDLPLWPPCCKKKVFHKRCIMEMAKNHGAHFFKCPLCNEKEKFSTAMKKSGVYVPDRDATWETGNAFADQTRSYSRCDAPECFCPKGRDHNSSSDSKPWKVVRCGACGAAGVHKRCGNLKNLTWRCPTCSRVLSDKRRSDVHNSSRIQRHHYDTSSDEGNSDNEMPVTSIREVIVSPPQVESDDSLAVRATDNSTIASLKNKIEQFPKSKRNFIVEQDSSDSDSCVSEGDEVFISPEAKEKLLQRRMREFGKQLISNKMKWKVREPMSVSNPVQTMSCEEVIRAPSFTPLAKDTIIRNRHTKKVELIKVKLPEIVSESNHSAVKIVLNDVCVDKDCEEIPVPNSSRNAVKEETITVDDGDSSDELEILSETIKPISATTSSTLNSILDASRGLKVEKPVIPAIFKSSSNHLQISNAFLSMINKIKSSKGMLKVKAANGSQPKSKDRQAKSVANNDDDVEIVSIDSDDEENASKSEGSYISKKRDRSPEVDEAKSTAGKNDFANSPSKRLRT